MRKSRLYFDASLVNHLDAPDAPEKMQETILFWEEVKTEKYEIIISNVFWEEVYKCQEPKRQFMIDKMTEIDYVEVEKNEYAEEIADELVKLGILKEKQKNDRLHIGCAIYFQCDYLVTWNIRHMLNVKIIDGVRIVTSILNYKNINIVSPTVFIGKEE
jgi:predicted nucleic acid-binding protein